MQVILQEKVANLGNVGDLVNVKPGYARNYLLPFSIAVPATRENMALFEKRRAELEKMAAEKLAAAKARAKKFADAAVTIEAQASEEGKLYGSIGPREIADAAVAAGYELQKSEVAMPEGPIRHVGETEVELTLYSDVHAKLKVIVAAGAESE